MLQVGCPAKGQFSWAGRELRARTGPSDSGLGGHFPTGLAMSACEGRRNYLAWHAIGRESRLCKRHTWLVAGENPRGSM